MFVIRNSFDSRSVPALAGMRFLAVLHLQRGIHVANFLDITRNRGKLYIRYDRNPSSEDSQFSTDLPTNEP